jgi:hypothetical protein
MPQAELVCAIKKLDDSILERYTANYRAVAVKICNKLSCSVEANIFKWCISINEAEPVQYLVHFKQNSVQLVTLYIFVAVITQ